MLASVDLVDPECIPHQEPRKQGDIESTPTLRQTGSDSLDVLLVGFLECTGCDLLEGFDCERRTSVGCLI